RASRLPKVEFILSSFFGVISSRGNFAVRCLSPNRDSRGGIYLRSSAPNSHLPDDVENSPFAKGRNGSPSAETFRRTERLLSNCSRVIPFTNGCSDASSWSIMSSSESRKQGSLNPRDR